MTELVLYCFPYAGGGARVFAPLAELAPSHVRIRAVEPPGRGARLREAPITDYDELVESLTGYLVVDLLRRPAGTRFAMLGHSAGAVPAVAVGQRMSWALGQPPARCFLAAAEAPHRTPHLASNHTSNLTPNHTPNLTPNLTSNIAQLAGAQAPPSDEELLATLAGYGVTPPGMLAEPLFVRHILPILRADFGIVAQYHKAGSLRVDFPFTLIAAGGDETVAADDVWAWSSHTSAGCRRVVLDGDHFSIVHTPAELLAVVAADLAEELVT